MNWIHVYDGGHGILTVQAGEGRLRIFAANFGKSVGYRGLVVCHDLVQEVWSRGQWRDSKVGIVTGRLNTERMRIRKSE